MIEKAFNLEDGGVTFRDMGDFFARNRYLEGSFNPTAVTGEGGFRFLTEFVEALRLSGSPKVDKMINIEVRSKDDFMD